VKNIASYFRVGDNLPLKVIEFDKEAKKIVLSVVEGLKNKGNEAQEEYYRLHPVPQSGPAGSAEIAPAPEQAVDVEEFSAPEEVGDQAAPEASAGEGENA
jgi:hypothetical protein